VRQVVGCGVVNVRPMVYLFIFLYTALVVHVHLFMISFFAILIPANSTCDEI
jgi:hypothetical protein